MKRTNVLAIAAIVLLFTATGSANAQSGSVVYYSSGSSQLAEPLVKAFNEHYPDIDVEVITAGSTALYTRVKAEQDNPRGDVVFMGLELFEANPELFEPYVSKHNDEFPPNAVAKDHRYYEFQTTIQTIGVNTDEMDLADAPKSWADLIDPKYKGKILMANPSLSGAGWGQLDQMVQLYGWDYVEKLVENAVFIPKTNVVPVQLGRGEFPIGLAEETKNFDQRQEGYPVEVIYPAEGVALRAGAVGIIKGGPNPENAKLFADFHNSKEAHEINVAVRNRRSSRHDVPPPDGLPPLQELSVDPNFDPTLAGKTKEETLQKFDQIFSQHSG